MHVVHHPVTLPPNIYTPPGARAGSSRIAAFDAAAAAAPDGAQRAMLSSAAALARAQANADAREVERQVSVEELYEVWENKGKASRCGGIGCVGVEE